VRLARQLMRERQGCRNSRLSEEQALVAKKWSEGASSLWRVVGKRQAGSAGERSAGAYFSHH